MPSVPGKGGGVPKRTEQRRRVNNENGQMNVTRAPGAPIVTMPDPDPEWHPVALQWYRSLAESGQSHYFEPSDWATAYYVAEAMHENLTYSKQFSAVLFASVMSAMSDLLATEGSRRRLRLELQRGGAVDEDADAAVAALDDYRKRLS